MRRKSGYVQSVDDTRDITQNGQTDVDQQISTTAALKEDTQRGQKNGEDDLADVAGFSISQI